MKFTWVCSTADNKQEAKDDIFVHVDEEGGYYIYEASSPEHWYVHILSFVIELDIHSRVSICSVATMTKLVQAVGIRSPTSTRKMISKSTIYVIGTSDKRLVEECRP